MRSLKRILFLRFAVAVTLVVIIMGVVLVFERTVIPGWVTVAVGLVIMLALLAGITMWTQDALTGDLTEIGRALEKIVVENDLDRMPQPRLSELSGLATDLDTIAGRVRENYVLLSNERDRLEAVLDNVNAGILMLGADGKIDLMNPAAERILGTTTDSALGRTFTEIHHTRAIDRAIERSMAGNEVSEEVRISLPRRRTLLVKANAIRSEDGSTTGVVCILEDVTSRRMLERTRRDFVANVSHELRTPVSNLRAVIDALLMGGSDDEEASAKFLAELDRESNRLVGIIEDLLILSRLESEEIAMREKPYRLAELLEEVVGRKVELAARNSVEIVFDRPVRDAMLQGDAKLVGTVFSNLLDNAIKYNRPGGRVEVTVSETGGDVTVDVTDTGIGIPDREQSKVFERFYRVDRARSRETGGTGLGLSIVKHVVELHGGDVSVKSAEGYGSTFSVILPAPPSGPSES